MKFKHYTRAWLFLAFALMAPYVTGSECDCCEGCEALPALPLSCELEAAKPNPVKKPMMDDFKKNVFSTKNVFVADFYDAQSSEDSKKQVATVNMSLYDVKDSSEQNQLGDMYGDNFRPLFNTGIRPFIYLSYFKICDNALKNQGLGKQLFEYGLDQAKRMHPNGLYFWRAVPLDGQHKKDALFKFYTNRGGIMLKDLGGEAIFYIDLAKLPQGTTASVA
jgi:hypothetical protein